MSNRARRAEFEGVPARDRQPPHRRPSGCARDSCASERHSQQGTTSMNRLFAIASLAACLTASAALAEVNDEVRNACREDYHKHCDKLEVGSPELRACMKSKATDLSKDCLKALV